MTTRLRATKSVERYDRLGHKFESIDETHRLIKESGGEDIVKWILNYTAVSSGTATEMDAPDNAFDGSVEEVTNVTFLTKANSIGSEFLKVPFSAAAGGSVGTEHYFFFDTNELTTITCLTRVLSIGSGSFHFWVDNGAGAQTEYYVWLAKPEISTVTFGLTMANMTDASSFDFEVDDGDGTVTHYYVWFDKTGSTGDPTGTGTGISADISGATTAANVAEIVKDLIHAKADVTCTRSGDDIIIVNGNNGEVIDAYESIAGTGCTFAIEQGGDDPSESGTAIVADISGATTAIDVAEVIDGLINAKTDVSCDNGGGTTLPIINANNGNVTDASHGGTNTGFTISIEQGGDDPNINQVIALTCDTKVNSIASSSFHFFVADGSGGETEYYIWINKGGADPDPADPTGTAIECDISGATTAITVAEVIDNLIDAKTDVSCDNGGTAVLPIINDQDGSVSTPFEGPTATGYVFIFQDGSLDANASGTTHSLDISGATTGADVGTIVVAAVTGVAGLTATGTGTMLVESDNTGNIDDVSQSGSSFGTITTLNQGRASYEGGYLYLLSSSANDNDVAAGHCREVTVIGWDENGLEVTDIIAMSGTTPVKLNERTKAVCHMFGSKFGTGDNDAAGNIILVTSSTGNKTTLLTIAAGETESNGARIYIPDGQKVLITNLTLFNTTNANTGATIVTPLLTGFEEESNLTPDYDHLTIVVFNITNSRSNVFPLREPRIGTNVAVITTTEREVGTVGNETFEFVMELYTFT